MAEPEAGRGKKQARGGRKAVVLLLSLLLPCTLLPFLAGRVPDSVPVPTFDEVRNSHRPSDGVLLDRRGIPLQEVRSDFRVRVLPWVPLSGISPSLVAAVLRSEDKRFRRHPGVDPVALLSAASGNLRHGTSRGASTVTMQLVSLLDGGGKGHGTRERLLAKARQIAAAVRMERAWTKDQILEAYLNRVPFRGELAGIAAASRGMFDKEPAGLDEAESAVLASLIRSPNAPPSAVMRRAALLCAALGWNVPPPVLAATARERLRAPFIVRPRHDLAIHAARILSPGPGERRISTLDAEVQARAEEALAQQLAVLSGKNVRDGAVLAAENASGEILAYVGSSGRFSPSPLVDGIRARRQAGSTLKPFLYGTAIESRILTAASLLDDSPVDVATERGLYAPRNYDREFRGPVSVRTGLAASLNVPAVRTLLLLGPDAMRSRLAAFGFVLPGSAEDYGASLALGTADVTLQELVNAYRTLANGGRWSPLTLRAGTSRGEAGRSARAITREAAFLVADLLADRGAREAAFGLAGPLSTPFWTAVKTGTSKDMRDNWCIGFSDRYTVGVWVGNSGGAPMWDVSGVSGAAPVWRDVMTFLHAGAPPRPASPPPGVVRRWVEFPGGAEPGREEWFVAGTEPSGGADGGKAVHPPRIEYPADGMVIALDPDIPDDLQRIFFEARGAGTEMTWRLDGRTVGPAGGGAVSWRPEPGVHSLEIVAPDGRSAHAVRFSVRGRPPKPRPGPLGRLNADPYPDGGNSPT